jgi:hypothetical protein
VWIWVISPEIETYLNADLLRRLWDTLTLPRAVREFWEAQL